MFLKMVNIVTSVSVTIGNTREKCDIFKAVNMLNKVKTENNDCNLLPIYLTSPEL